MSNTDDRFAAIGIALFILAVVISLFTVAHGDDECARKGGVRIYGRYSSACVKKDSVIP